MSVDRWGEGGGLTFVMSADNVDSINVRDYTSAGKLWAPLICTILQQCLRYPFVLFMAYHMAGGTKLNREKFPNVNRPISTKLPMVEISSMYNGGALCPV